ncbi:MAG: hypothetical protein V3T03_08185 [Candidatus Bipolaricaulota bacterium]
MKRMLCFFLVLACIGATGSSIAMAESVALGFGFGGPMAMAFFPDMSDINTFLSENGLDPMSDFLIGAGGGGRGGVIGGPVFGGTGWGMLAISEGEDLSAKLIFGGGGLDVGRAIGGDEGSVLTVGAVLGAGANVLSVTGYLAQTIDPEGLVPEPTHREVRRIVGFVQPYVSMSSQLLPWVGFDFRIGYVLPLLGAEFGDFLGIPAPSLELSGPTISFGFVFGGIGLPAESDDDDKPSGHAQVTSASDGSFVVDAGDELVIENGLGDIVISGYAVDATQPASDLVVEWQAVRTAAERRIDELQVLLDVTDMSTTLKTVGAGRVDYILRVPAGIDLTVTNGAGDVNLVSYDAQTIIIENGAGEVNVQSVRAIALIVAGGVGRVDLADVDAQTLIAELGIGEIVLGLPVSASARVIAKAGIGDVSIDRFPGMIGGVRGFLGKSGNVTLGHGERMVELNVGIGRIGIEMRVP